MSKNIKRIITACLFIIVLTGTLLIMSKITIPKSNAPESGMEEVAANGILAENPDTVDVIFLGDSETYCTFIPLQIWKDEGFTTYIDGTSAQTLDYSLTMLQRALSRHDLKMVFLEANAIYRKESKEIPYAKLCELLPVFRYHNRWKTLTSEDFTADPEYTWTDYKKGYNFSKEVIPTYKSNYIHFEKTDEKSRITPGNRYYVKEIKKLCDEKDVKLVFISAPSPANFTYKRHNATEALAEKLGCEFIDMNLIPEEELQLDWTKDTRDKGDHLNYYGAVKTTAWFSDYLKSTGLLKSRKGDADCAVWDAAVAQFEKNDLKGEKLR